MLASFALRLITGRWFTVFASLLIMSTSGATYMFGLYSSQIKSSLSYDQTTLNLLSFFKDLGGNIGIISGLINEVTPPWVNLLTGAVMNFLGYFMIWLSVTKRAHRPRLWQMCLYICIGANSQSFANTGSLVTCVKNFPASRVVVLGLLKGFVGLSGAIITQLYHAFYGGDTESLILLIGWLPASVSFIFLPAVRVMKAVGGERELKVFYDLLYVSLGLAGFLMVVIVVQTRLEFYRIEYVISALVVIILLLAPLGIVAREELKMWRREISSSDASREAKVASHSIELHEQDKPLEHDPSSSSIAATTQENEKSCWKTAFKAPKRGEDYTILQALFSVDMLILFTATTFGVGGTLTAIDNLGQIGKSLGYPPRSVATFVSLVSIWNYLGRVASGFLSEFLLARYGLPRPAMLTLILLLSCAGHLAIAFGVERSLYFSSALMGFCFGAQWPLIFAIISEIFGLRYYSTLYNLGAGASPVGNYILNVKVAGGLYDREALRQMALNARGEGEDLSCVGVECYKTAFLVITGATLAGCAVSFALVVRTREFYRKLREQSSTI